MQLATSVSRAGRRRAAVVAATARTLSSTATTTTTTTKPNPAWTSQLGATCAPRDVSFVLFDVLKMTDTFADKGSRYEGHSREFVEEALATAIKIAETEFLPHDRKADAHEPEFDPKTGGVKLIPEVGPALEAFKEAGFYSLHADNEFGGMQLPSAVTNALLFPFYAANVPTSSFPFLTIAAGNMLRRAGSREQLETYLRPMLEGRFTGTMNLSETQAGSSLGDITTKAFKQPDGTYKIVGKKMWISAAEHSLSENIVHMLLAKVADPAQPDKTPTGVKSISLFIVPKFRRDPSSGKWSVPNDCVLAGLNHKMGWRGTPNTVMVYGEQNNCVGELLGQEGKGLATMFLMMNEARCTIGVIATALGYAGMAASARYAYERRQGRSPDNKDPASQQVLIKDHADVRRMLLQQRAYVEASLALCLYASRLVDRTHHPSPNTPPHVTKDEALLLDTLTPIVKSWPSEWCLEANKWAIQIHGGYGYTRDFPVEMYYRTNRLNMIHEGTAGIQALDLLGRKVAALNGLPLVLREIRAVVADAKSGGDAALVARANALAKAADTLESTTKKLTSAKPAVMLANSHEYLNMAGHVVMGWMWLAMETAAAKKLARGEALTADDEAFLRTKRDTSRYYFAFELPKIYPQAEVLQSLDVTVLEAHF